MLIQPWSEPGTAVWDGETGSGKSYQAAQKVIEWLEAGQPVITNIDIHAVPWRLFKPKWGEYIPLFRPDQDPPSMGPVAIGHQLVELIKDTVSRHPGKHVLIMIDECALIFSAANWKLMPEGMRAFLVQHRKLKCSMIAIAQNVNMLDVFIRRMAREFVRHRNLANDSKLGNLLVFFTSNFHRQWCMANKDGKPVDVPKEYYGKKLFFISEKKAAVYDSGQLHSFKSNVQFKRPKKRFVRLCGLVVVSCVLLVLGYGFFRGIMWLLKPVQNRVSAFSSGNLAGKPVSESKGLLETKTGTILSIFDEDATGHTVYVVDFPDGVQELRLRSDRWGALQRYEMVGQKYQFVVPVVQRRNLAEEIQEKIKLQRKNPTS